MTTYVALTLLSLADGTHIEPGQSVELNDESATILLAGGYVMTTAAAELIEESEEATMPIPASEPRRRR